jgi:phosphoglycolate phosphatase
MKYRLLIFDFDGTLADSMPWAMSVMHTLADKHGVRRIDEDELDTIRGFDARTFIKHMEVPMWKSVLIGNDLRKMMAQDIRKIPLFDGISDLLAQLSAMGATLAVVSSNSAENVRNVLGPANTALIPYFECGASAFGKQSKYRKILAKSGIPAQAAISIGDEIRDLEAARHAKIAFGAVSWGYTRLDALLEQGPDEVFERVEEIYEKLR